MHKRYWEWDAMSLLLLLGLLALPVLSETSSSQTQPEHRSRTHRIMVERCAVCHGPEGGGDGRLSSKLIPPPANLTLIRDSARMGLSIVRHGIPGTAMRPFPHLSIGRISLLGLHGKGLPDIKERDWLVPTEAEQKAAAKIDAAALYKKECSGCHGAAGRGDGEWAKGDPHIWPKPANFHARSSETERLYAIISEGRPGTMMPPFAWKLPPAECWALARHVRGMFSSLSRARLQRGSIEYYHNPLNPTDAAVIAHGEEVYQRNCSKCHGVGGVGTAVAPAHNDRVWRFGGGADTALYSVMDKGVPGQIMPSFRSLDPNDRWAVISYLRSLGGLPDPRLPGEVEAEIRKGEPAR